MNFFQYQLMSYENLFNVFVPKNDVQCIYEFIILPYLKFNAVCH